VMMDEDERIKVHWAKQIKKNNKKIKKR